MRLVKSQGSLHHLFSYFGSEGISTSEVGGMIPHILNHVNILSYFIFSSFF